MVIILQAYRDVYPFGKFKAGIKCKILDKLE